MADHKRSSASDPVSPQRVSLTADEVVCSSPNKEKIHLTEAENTMILTAWLRILDAKSPRPILNDPYSQRILDRCDLAQFSSRQSTRHKALLPVDSPGFRVYCCTRAKMYDQWCQEFISSHADEPVTVLHLACGLDCRCLRVQRGSNVRWIDVDRPFVVDLRKKLLHDIPGDYSLRSLEVGKLGWIKDIPADRPTMIIAEGLFPYLPPEVVVQVFRDLVEYFGHGQLVFDIVGSLFSRYTRYTFITRSFDAELKWGLDDPHVIETFHPQLKMQDRLLKSEFMKGVLPVFGTFGDMLSSLHPKEKYNGQLLRFEF